MPSWLAAPLAVLLGASVFAIMGLRAKRLELKAEKKPKPESPQQ